LVFCDNKGRAIPWLQPLQSITVNGPHAVIIAPSLVSVEMFRVEHTYELMIARHEARARQGRQTAICVFAVGVRRPPWLSVAGVMGTGPRGSGRNSARILHS